MKRKPLPDFSERCPACRGYISTDHRNLTYLLPRRCQEAGGCEWAEIFKRACRDAAWSSRGILTAMQTLKARSAS